MILNNKAKDLLLEIINEEGINNSLSYFLFRKVYVVKSEYRISDINEVDSPILSLSKNENDYTSNFVIFKNKKDLGLDYESDLNIYSLYRNPVSQFKELNKQNIQNKNEIEPYLKFCRIYSPKLTNNYNSQIILNDLLNSSGPWFFSEDDLNNLVMIVKMVDNQVFKNDPSIIDKINYRIKKRDDT